MGADKFIAMDRTDTLRAGRDKTPTPASDNSVAAETIGPTLHAPADYVTGGRTVTWSAVRSSRQAVCQGAVCPDK